MREQIKLWEKKLDPITAKKLFIRESAIRAYKSGNGEIEKVTVEVVKEAIDLITVGKMTKDEVGSLITRLEEARIVLASLTQGFQIAFAEEKEPEFKKRHEREKERKRLRLLKLLKVLLQNLELI